MDNQFPTTVTIAGVTRKATCEYTVRRGRAIPYAVWMDGILYSVDNWKDRLNIEAQAVEDERKTKDELIEGIL